MRIADGNLYAAIALDEFQHGTEVLHGPIQVELTIRPNLRRRICLHRLAGPDVRLSRTSPSSTDANANHDADMELETRLTNLLRQKFEGIFPEFAYFDNMKPPAGGSWDKVRSLKLQRLEVENEWCEIGLQFEPEPTTDSIATPFLIRDPHVAARKSSR